MYDAIRGGGGIIDDEATIDPNDPYLFRVTVASFTNYGDACLGYSGETSLGAGGVVSYRDIGGLGTPIYITTLPNLNQGIVSFDAPTTSITPDELMVIRPDTGFYYCGTATINNQNVYVSVADLGNLFTSADIGQTVPVYVIPVNYLSFEKYPSCITPFTITFNPASNKNAPQVVVCYGTDKDLTNSSIIWSENTDGTIGTTKTLFIPRLHSYYNNDFVYVSLYDEGTWDSCTGLYNCEIVSTFSSSSRVFKIPAKGPAGITMNWTAW